MTAAIPLSAAPRIASYSLTPEPTNLAIQEVQTRHRLRLLHAWGDLIGPGARVLEIGCGQGDCTAALAEAVGDDGHVDAVDPGDLEYGAPFTLGEAQGHISAGPLGQRITWHQATPEAFLANNEGEWDVAVLAHCVWYFKSADAVSSLLAALRGRVRRILIAEWALHASEPGAVPHVLAALARATLVCHSDPGNEENIQTPLAPGGIKDIASKAGWEVEREDVVVPDEQLQDGRWETGSVVGSDFLQEMEESGVDERVAMVVAGAREATRAAVDSVGGVKNVRAMDVWTAVLKGK